MKQRVGSLHVDAGLMMLGDPCYTIGQEIGKLDWKEFLSRYANDDAVMPIEKGTALMVSTGYGDGTYPVYADITKSVFGPGMIVRSVTVVFDGDDIA